MDCQSHPVRKRKMDSGDGTNRYYANARERDRTHSVNSAFIMVRNLIPTEPPDRKLSKIEILRLATSYIAHLQCKLVADRGDEQPCARLQIGSWQEARLPVCTFCLASQKKVYQRPMPLLQDSRLLYPSSHDTLGVPPPWPPLLRPLSDINRRHSVFHDLHEVYCGEDLRWRQEY